MSRLRRAVIVTASLAALLLGASGAMAITNGQPDNGRHPYVGLMVALDTNGFPLWRCSGSELTSTVYLTAGHCTTAPAAHVEVWFSEGPVTTDPAYLAAVAASPTGAVSCYSASFTGYPCKGDAGGTPHPNPGFCNPCGSGAVNFARHDTGVVKLTSSVTLSRYAQLPTAGLVDTLANKSPLDLVGYGVQFAGPARASGTMRRHSSSPATSRTAMSSSGRRSIRAEAAVAAASATRAARISRAAPTRCSA
jgi:hypothetical protein